MVIRNPKFIHVIINDPRGRVWMFTAIYVGPSEDRRKVLWEELKKISGTTNKMWMLDGDFNDITSIIEKK